MIAITLASRTGVPLHAVCVDCGQMWDKGYDDPDAADFPAWVRIHMRVERDRDYVLHRT